MTISKNRIHLPHAAIVKAPGLLPMLYLPAELAAELGIPVQTLFEWLRSGAPFEQDPNGSLWINGRKFAGWVEINRKGRKPRQKLKDGQAYCLHCKQVVDLIDARQERVKGRLVLIKGHCAQCGTRLNRGGCSDPTPELPAGQRTS